ncbi:TetR/AcrR family transcriptional regulator [Streptomyces sp. NPDC102405]|uniref:TetR/AcrR family transcriptional regulator n=1 Tax=Streptomyces sp. NPDC102405 TaxID=3366170 RepID=UPI00380A311A
MANPKSSARGPGRPRAFDADAVLDTAVEVFWRDGFHGASVPDISKATGLSTSSLYNAYDSKLGLFEAALDRYLDVVVGNFMYRPLLEGGAGLQDIEAYLDRLESTVTTVPPRGCLAINTIAEFRDPSPAVAKRTERYREELRAGLSAALNRAVERGEIAAGSVETRLDSLVPIIIAFNLFLTARVPDGETRGLMRAARAVLRS